MAAGNEPITYYKYLDDSLTLRVSIMSNGNYSVELEFENLSEDLPERCDSAGPDECPDVWLKVPFTQRELKSVTRDTSGTLKRNVLSIKQGSNNVTIQHKDVAFSLTKQQWYKFVEAANDLAANYAAMQPYFESRRRAGNDLCMLKHLVISLARMNSGVITYMYQRHLCAKHSKLWSERHVTTCTANNTDTWCHKVAAISLRIVDETAVSTILKDNKLGPLYVSMDQIIGTDFDDMVHKIHHEACYMLSTVFVYRAARLLPQYREYMGKYLINYCVMCGE